MQPLLICALRQSDTYVADKTAEFVRCFQKRRTSVRRFLKGVKPPVDKRVELEVQLRFFVLLVTLQKGIAEISQTMERKPHKTFEVVARKILVLERLQGEIAGRLARAKCEMRSLVRTY
ncbi:MAG: hypothetical protein HY398_00440 [Candidatus Doudnabacteria bacterium]|nr:hypothetical protein [Candidatus Doudnabacteria bacterium]